INGNEGRAKALQAGIVLVAGRLVDGALAPELRLQRLDRDAVRLHRAVAATFADGRIDQHAARRIFHQAALAAAAPFAGAGLDEDDRRSALELAALLHDRVELVAMTRDDAGRDLGGGIEMRILRYEIDVADAFGVHLESDLLRRQFAVDMLAA